MSDAFNHAWPRKLVSSWAMDKAEDLRHWERKVRKAYRIGTPLGDVCGAYADALLECAEVMDRCAARLSLEADPLPKARTLP